MSAPPHSTPAATLLLCVDLQSRFIAAMEHGARVQRRCAFAIAAATGLGLPVAFTEQAPEKIGRTAPELLALAPAAPAWGKIAFSAFGDDRIRAALLDERAIGHLLLCGLETPVCVYQTALAARAAGLTVTLLSDAVAARRGDDARACLDALSRAGVHVLPAETVFYALLGDVHHPFFKTYTALVKSHA
jgi:nicotinamidase-related amidase